ncbi:PorT family protein [Hymenobacter sp. BT175]|uniref:porin family protein n=1 Tax=Hymenobacter translucens TaxID=2886507 RepID=UPI001D0ED37E|nr:porin family protein [Hymenobacter translucens]MCC2547371.1 PorT family protein [Hymenobacter translucens]
MKLLHLALPVAITLLLTTAAHAQFGVTAGVTTATITDKSGRTDRTAAATEHLGYQLGVFYEHKLNTRFSLRPGLQFSRQNTGLSVDDRSVADGSYKADYRLRRSYLDLPVLVQVNFGRFYLEAGPQGSLLLFAHEKGNESVGSIVGTYNSDFERPATDRYERFDVALCAGLGVKLPAGFGLGLRASTGLLYLRQEFGSYGGGYHGSLRNQAVQASVSYQLQPRS